MRIKSLDSVRGIAAFIVVFCHCLGTLSQRPTWAFHFPGSLLDAGDGAVFVFFALSGCVLFLSLEKRGKLAYLAYLTKRFFRIYPALAVAVLASALLFEVVQPRAVPGVSEWFNRHWQTPPTLMMILGHFAMTDSPNFQQLDSPMWSLVHEIRISVIFPFIALWVAANWRVAMIVSTIVSAICTLIELRYQLNWMFDPVRTLSYAFLFTAGAALALHAERVRRYLGRCPLWLQIGLWAIALRMITVPVEHYLALVTGFAALMLIALAFGTPATDRVLSTNAVLTSLGRISYSLYLVHFPIIMTSVHLFHDRLPLPAIFGIAIVVSLGVAELMHRLVEQPSIKLGRRLAALPALQWTLPRRILVASDSAP